MRYKAIVSDFDGTLVDGTFRVHSKVAQGIKKYIEAGGIFSIATGRDYYGVLKSICVELGLTSFHIVRGGAEIVSGETHEVEWGKYIDEDRLRELLKFLGSRQDIFYAVERGDLTFTKGAKAYELFGPEAKYGDLDELHHDSVPKVFLPASLNKKEIVNDLYEEVQEKFPNLHVVRTTYKDYVGMDINDGGVSKHLALLEYSKMMGLDPSEIVGVGDSYNDYPLLSACGYKVAMGNAPKELLDIVDMVVGTQEENGVLEVIEWVMGEGNK